MRVDGISQNLHEALARHNKLVHEDITTALIEHARSVISYERQRLRELETLRPDVKSADKKSLPVSTGPPRPAFIPKLDEDVKPTPARSDSAPPLKVAGDPPPPINVPKPGSAASFMPPLPVITPGSAASFMPTSPAPTLPSKSPMLSSLLPPQSPGAGPSIPRSRTPTSPTFAAQAAIGPPLGGRFIDGSRSMFISPSASSSADRGPLSAGPSSRPFMTPSSAGPSSPFVPSAPPPTASTSVLPSMPVHQVDPLGPLSPNAAARRSATLGPSSSPLSPGSNGYAQYGSANGSNVDPLGLGSPQHMSQSMRLPPTPSRKRLDAREAASKLANFF